MEIGLCTAMFAIGVLALGRSGPFSMYAALTGLWLLIVALIFIKNIRLRKIIIQKERDHQQLGHLNAELENMVSERADTLLLKQRQIQSFINNVEAGAYLKNERHEFVLVNNRFCEIMGVSPKDILGTTGYALMPRTAAWRMVELEQQTAKEGQHVELYDLFANTEHDTNRVYSLYLFPVTGPEGQMEGTGGMVIDVTERHRLSQAIIEAKEAAEKSNLVKSAFLANISHEIRTPLNGIIGMADLLLRTRLAADQISMASTIKNAGYSLLAVLNDILDISKIEAGKMTFESRPFSPQDLIFDIVSGHLPMAKEKGLELIVKMAPDIPWRLFGDQHRLRQIILNLVSNAVKFTSRGEVIISLEILDRLHCGDHEEDDWAMARVKTSSADHPDSGQAAGELARLRFSVIDSGIGVPLEKREVIFEAFEQADTSTTRTYGGTGLGLAICHRLLRLMDSKLNLESQLGRGSNFWFDLVMPINDADEPAAPKLDIAKLGGRNVLLADDNAVCRQVLMEELKSWGLNAMESAGVDESVKLLSLAASGSQPFDLVITDHLMPEKSGLDLLRAMRSSPALRSTPVILLSSADLFTESPGKDGFFAVITKPSRPHDLLQAVFAALETETTSLETALPDIPAGGQGRALRILLVEDMEMNQLVATRLLEELGHQVTVADDGAQALNMLRQRELLGFDLIFMDIQMPVMDGVETTARLRELEKLNNWPPLLIVAMTAHAMKGDRGKYLAAGMDDYITKPLILTELDRLINRLLDRLGPPPQPPGQTGGPPPPPSPAPPGAPLDEEIIRLSFGANQKLLHKSMELYIRDAPDLMKNIFSALEAGDIRQTAASAHALKGISSYYTKGGPFELARQLDSAAKGGPWPEVRPALQELAASLNQSVTVLMTAMSERIGR